MSHLSASQLAKELNLSKGRISQYVSGGQLDGCYEGSGRARRFDLQASATKLGRVLDAGQMMGNGAKTKNAMGTFDDSGLRKPSGSTSDVDDEYQIARTQKAQEEARRLRRVNAQDEGDFLLASEVTLQVRKQLAQEIAEFESVMREAARAVADQLGVDFKTTRKILIDAWRGHRKIRESGKRSQGQEADLTEKESAQDI